MITQQGDFHALPLPSSVEKLSVSLLSRELEDSMMPVRPKVVFALEHFPDRGTYGFADSGMTETYNIQTSAIVGRCHALALGPLLEELPSAAFPVDFAELSGVMLSRDITARACRIGDGRYAALHDATPLDDVIQAVFEKHRDASVVAGRLAMDRMVVIDPKAQTLGQYKESMYGALYTAYTGLFERLLYRSVMNVREQFLNLAKTNRPAHESIVEH